ncbi:MAG: DUF3800 domain-containing protein [Bacteroidales bacterium]|nr:DUF3800 domain-containing protein [Bacteroidales bacterium]
MTQRTFNIYCDESTHLPNDGRPYMIYGYVSVASNQIKVIREQLKAIKAKYNFTGEWKWTGIHDRTYQMYQELVEYFFSVSGLNFRAVVVDKSQIDETRAEYTFNDFYFRMYFQLLHHKTDMSALHNIYFDIKDTCSQEKLHKLKEILKYNTSIGNFQFIRSHESVFLQLADVLMGAINYYLRILAEDIKGNVIAKRRIIEYVKGHSAVPLTCTSPFSASKVNLFYISLKR